MGYSGGKNNYEERDRLYQQSLDGKPVNRNEVKKGLNELFKSKPQGLDARCQKGHSWIRDFNEKEKCAYCRIPRPPEESTPPGFAPGTKL